LKARDSVSRAVRKHTMQNGSEVQKRSALPLSARVPGGTASRDFSAACQNLYVYFVHRSSPSCQYRATASLAIFWLYSVSIFFARAGSLL
jgi:hypothetical protein